MASRNDPSKYPVESAWSNTGGRSLHAPHSCSGLLVSASGDSKGLPQHGQTAPWIGENSDQQVEQKYGIEESLTGELQ
jgi:hypothetical protein